MESTKTAGRKAVIFAAAFMALVLAGCRNTEKNAEAVKEDAVPQAGGRPEAETVNTGWEPQPELAGRPEAEPETESHPATGSQQGQDIGGTEPEEGETLPGQPDGAVKAAERKTLPEGWELTLASEDWGLSFTEPGTAPKGNATAGDLAWYDGYYGRRQRKGYLSDF